MKINKLIKIFFIILGMFFVIIALVIFSREEYKMKVLENINFFAKAQSQQEDNSTSSRDTTIIDVTGIIPGKETEHEHLYKTMYDDNKHWKECTVCGAIAELENHLYNDRGWTQGSADSCSEQNVHEFVCNCGSKYSMTVGRKAHQKTTTQNTFSYHKYDVCLTCGLIDNMHKCCKSDNTEITCGNLGKCKICGYTYTNRYHGSTIVGNTSKDYYCDLCNLFLGKNNYAYITRDNNGELKHYTSVTLTNGAVVDMNLDETNDNTTINISSSNNNNGYTLESVQKINYIEHAEKEQWIRKGYRFKLGSGMAYLYHMEFVKPDITEPIISNISGPNGSLISEWSRTKPIIITGLENYCNTVNVEIVNDEGNIIFTGNAIVKDGNYSISCTPELEINLNGKMFKAIVTDTLGNKIEKEFEIAKVDSFAPKITSDDKVADGWAREKLFTFTANDYGIGDVEIGFNDVEDYRLASQEGDIFSREYKLIGDVYFPREANIYYKDGLGNVSTKKIIIDKLDNTTPTITNVDIHNNKLSIISHDRHEIYGEGSGVVKYRYMISNEKIENMHISLINDEVNVGENIIIANLPEVKYVYIVAEDLVRKREQSV